jgi:hypothetical protein
VNPNEFWGDLLFFSVGEAFNEIDVLSQLEQSARAWLRVRHAVAPEGQSQLSSPPSLAAWQASGKSEPSNEKSASLPVRRMAFLPWRLQARNVA